MGNVKGHVDGTKRDHRVMLYGLSTCGWCEDARKFLVERGVDFDYAYVDLLDGDELAAAVEDVKKWNEGMIFPLVVVNGSDAVVGYRPERLEEVLGL
ncbi:MAG: glutaredoxin family protein [Candidatus Eisenbacteria bacterium]|nr:glutaredoxin family protein [Candidatus Eisenbacteria bacterium]